MSKKAQMITVHKHTRRGGAVIVNEYQRRDHSTPRPVPQRAPKVSKPDPEDGTGIEIKAVAPDKAGEHIIKRDLTDVGSHPQQRRGRGVAVIGGHGAKQGQGITTLSRDSR